jgi:hypothetical protein
VIPLFERFNEQARRAVDLAQLEARGLGHNHVGTEHILLGLLAQGQGTAAQALQGLDISLEAVREAVVLIVGRGEQAVSERIPFTPRSKTVLELSLREALHLGHSYIGTGALLLALVREEDGLACQFLVRLGATPVQVRARVLQVLRDDPDGEGLHSPGGESPAVRVTTRLAARAGRAAADPLRLELGLVRRIAMLVEAVEGRLAAIEEQLGLASPVPEHEAAEPVEVAAEEAVPDSLSDTPEVARLRSEVERLAGLLREHDIDPGELAG